MSAYVWVEMGLALVCLGCFVYVLLTISEGGERRKAVVLFLLTPVLIGPLLTFLMGVRRASRLGIENAMTAWTVAVVLLVLADLGRLWTLGARLEASFESRVQAGVDLARLQDALHSPPDRSDSPKSTRWADGPGLLRD